MAYRPWTTPTGLLSGRRGGGSYSMAGPGNRSASISALQAISNPGSVANIAAPVMPADSLPLSVQADTPITSAMRGPGPRRSSAPVVGGGPSLRSQATPAPEMDFGGEDFMGDYMGPRSSFAGTLPGMTPGGRPMTPLASAGLSPQIPGGSSGPMVPQEIKGNLPAIRDWRKSGLSFDKWTQTLGASPWF